jgi:hypothetical protein
LTTGSFPHDNFSCVYWNFTIGFFPFHRGIMWSIKIQYTELKLLCGNDPVVKNSIYINGDLDLWPNDPKIYRVFPLPQGNHVQQDRFRMITLVLYIGSLPNLATWFPYGRGRTLFILGSLPLYDPVVKNYIYINGDLDLWPNDPKIYRVFPLPLGNHVAKFGKDSMDLYQTWPHDSPVEGEEPYLFWGH